MKHWTDMVLWGVALVSLMIWLLAVLAVRPMNDWIHVLLVISASFAVTGLLRQMPARPRR